MLVYFLFILWDPLDCASGGPAAFATVLCSAMAFFCLKRLHWRQVPEKELMKLFSLWVCWMYEPFWRVLESISVVKMCSSEQKQQADLLCPLISYCFLSLWCQKYHPTPPHPTPHPAFLLRCLTSCCFYLPLHTLNLDTLEQTKMEVQSMHYLLFKCS